MKRCKITAIRKTEYKDLMEKYENPMEHACDIEEGQVFITEGWKRPEGFCESAWESISPFVMTLAYGGSDIYEGWMKNKNSAMIICNAQIITHMIFPLKKSFLLPRHKERTVFKI